MFTFYPSQQMPPNRNDLVIFSSDVERDFAALTEFSRTHLEGNLRSLSVTLLTINFGSSPSKVSEELSRSLAVLSIEDRLRIEAIDAEFIGCLLKKNTSKRNARLMGLIRAGAAEVFKQRECILTAPVGWTFSKPSGAKDVFFIKAANALASEGEVELLATGLLAFTHPNVAEIFCDTSGILLLCQTLGLFLNRLGSTPRMPQIATYSSYQGHGSQKFNPLQPPLVLISATTSGNLAREMQERNAHNLRLVTLFNKNPSCKHSKTAYCVEAQYAEQKREDDKLKRPQSPIPIKLANEWFSSEANDHHPHLLSKHDAPTWLGPALKVIAGHKLFRIGINDHLHSSDTFLDLTALKANAVDRIMKASRDQIERALSPMRLGAIVSDGSEQAKVMKDSLGRVFPVTRDIEAQLPDKCALLRESSKHILVLVPFVRSGRSVELISRQLRNSPKNARLTYLIWFSMMESDSVTNTLRNNLRRKDQDGNFHRVTILHEWNAEPWNQGRAWSDEKSFWLGIPNRLKLSTTEKKAITRRQEDLRQIEAGEENALELLFLSLTPGKSHTIRSNYAFDLRKEKGAPLSQEEVFFTVCALLCRARRRSDVKGLKPSVHSRAVLAPGNFDRFNDEILQACLLRAAHSLEIDYTGTSAISRQMADLLRYVFHTNSEATAEFLLALCQNRLQLDAAFKKEIQKAIDAKLPFYKTKSPLCYVLARLYVRSKKAR